MVMPFGMMNLAATFYGVIRKVLADHHAFSGSLIDDIIIFSETYVFSLFRNYLPLE